MEFITVDKSNIDTEHICCSIVDKKGETGVSSKKSWLTKEFDNGLVFLKLNVRGKVFIEYMPASNAWCPINADNYMHINCFWVSGQYQGQGYASELLKCCIQDAKDKGMHGLTVVASDKKRGYLSDPKYLMKKGFIAIETAKPFFVLYYLPFSEDAPVPSFKENAKYGKIDEKGMVLYYTSQCPFTGKYVPLVCEIAKKKGITITTHRIDSAKDAQNGPTPFPTYSFYYDGNFVTNEIINEKKFEKLFFSDK